MTPIDWNEPEWENARKCHDWKNHVTAEVQSMWATFTEAQQVALARQAQDAADSEEWD